MINFEPETLDFELVRSRRRTADIVIERDGSLVVRVPEALDDDAVAELVESKRYWIYRNLAEWRELNSSRVLREFVGGEGFLYFGRNHRLSLSDDLPRDLVFRDGRFLLRRSLIMDGTAERAREAFRTFYTDRAQCRLTTRARYFAPKVGVRPSSVRVRDLGHRWGACSPMGDLSFHWKCCMAPLSVIDYIVVHELCHMHHLDHTQAFWNEVDKVLPSYKERKQWLRLNGARLEI